MGMQISIKYYRDVWQEDDGFTRELEVSDAVIVNLRKQVEILALYDHTYAVLSINGNIEARYSLQCESGEWRLCEVE